MANGSSVTTANMKMIVRAASRMLSAISFGVLRRDALSTSPIIRSRNVSPGLAVISMTTRSDSTRVPPVTALRSPPASLMTGADSPVMADSSTEAMPSTTVPSPGIRSPASQTTRSPLRSWGAGTRASRPSVRRRAVSSDRVRRRLAACALPRPSATASAKLANSTVNQSQMAIWPTNSSLEPCWKRPATYAIVVMTEPTSTTNMTGLRACQRGSSFLKLSPMAGTMMSRSHMLECRRRRYCSERPCCSMATSVGQLAGRQLEVLEKWAQRERRKERQGADDEDHADQQASEQRSIGGERAPARRHDLLAGQRASQRQQRDHEQEASDPHVGSAHRVVVDGVPGQAGESAAVVAELRGERVQDLAESVRARVERSLEARREQHRYGREAEDRGRPQQKRQRSQPDLLRLDLLAQVLRRAADHQAGDEHRDDREHQHAVEARADTARRDLAELDEDQRDHATDGREAVVGGVDRAGAGSRGGDGELGRVDRPEPDRLALHVAARLRRGVGLADADVREGGVAHLLGARGDRGRSDEDQGHGSADGDALLHVADPAAEHDGQAEGNPQLQEDLEVVGEPVGVLERVRAVRVKRPAAVVA